MSKSSRAYFDSMTEEEYKQAYPETPLDDPEYVKYCNEWDKKAKDEYQKWSDEQDRKAKEWFKKTIESGQMPF